MCAGCSKVNVLRCALCLNYVVPVAMRRGEEECWTCRWTAVVCECKNSKRSTGVRLVPIERARVRGTAAAER